MEPLLNSTWTKGGGACVSFRRGVFICSGGVVMGYLLCGHGYVSRVFALYKGF